MAKQTVTKKRVRKTGGRPLSDIMPVIDELMTTLQVLYPRLYNGVMNKL